MVHGWCLWCCPGDIDGAYLPTTNESAEETIHQLPYPVGIAKLASQACRGYVGCAASLSKAWILDLLNAIEQN